MKHTLKEQEGVFTLVINGKPSVCPFKTTAWATDNLGRPVPVNQTCNSQCPHFTKEADNQISLSCTPTRMYIGVGDKPTLQIEKT